WTRAARGPVSAARPARAGTARRLAALGWMAHRQPEARARSVTPLRRARLRDGEHRLPAEPGGAVPRAAPRRAGGDPLAARARGTVRHRTGPDRPVGRLGWRTSRRARGVRHARRRA